MPEATAIQGIGEGIMMAAPGTPCLPMEAIGTPCPTNPEELTPIMARMGQRRTYSDNGFVPGRRPKDDKNDEAAKDDKEAGDDMEVDSEPAWDNRAATI